MKVLCSALRTLFLAAVFTYAILYARLTFETKDEGQEPVRASVVSG